MPGPSDAVEVVQPHELRAMGVEMAREQLAMAAVLLPNPAYQAEYAARRRALGLAEELAGLAPEGDDEQAASNRAASPAATNLAELSVFRLIMLAASLRSSVRLPAPRGCS